MQVSWVHIDVADPIPAVLAGESEYVYLVVDDYTRTVYTGQVGSRRVQRVQGNSRERV